MKKLTPNSHLGRFRPSGLSESERLARPDLLFKAVHLVGILGKGQAGLSQLLQSRGCKVSGSDRNSTDMVVDGIRHFAGHSAANLTHGLDFVIVSAAIPADNPEVVEAKRRGIPVLERSQFLQQYLRGEHLVSIVGSQGKTTTTALLAEVFKEAGREPGALVGAAIPAWNNQSALPGRSIFFAETCEYSKQLMDFRPKEIVLTHIDESFHPETFESPLDTLNTFTNFIGLLPTYEGILYYNGDCNIQHQVVDGFEGKRVSYGLGENCDIRGCDIGQHRNGSTFHIEVKGERIKGAFFTPLPGQWNVKNTVAVIAVALQHNIPPNAIRKALIDFARISRRFDVLHDDPAGATVIEHLTFQPPAVRDLISEARNRYPDKQCAVVFNSYDVAVLQGQSASYATAFRGADKVFLRPVQPAFQQTKAMASRIDLEALAEAIRRSSYTSVELLPEPESAAIDASLGLLETRPDTAFVMIGPPGRHLAETLAGEVAK